MNIQWCFACFMVNGQMSRACSERSSAVSSFASSACCLPSLSSGTNSFSTVRLVSGAEQPSPGPPQSNGRRSRCAAIFDGEDDCRSPKPTLPSCVGAPFFGSLTVTGEKADAVLSGTGHWLNSSPDNLGVDQKTADRLPSTVRSRPRVLPPPPRPSAHSHLNTSEPALLREPAHVCPVSPARRTCSGGRLARRSSFRPAPWFRTAERSCSPDTGA